MTASGGVAGAIVRKGGQIISGETVEQKAAALIKALREEAKVI